MSNDKNKIGDIVTANELYTNRESTGQFMGYELESKENTSPVVGLVLVGLPWTNPIIPIKELRRVQIDSIQLVQIDDEKIIDALTEHIKEDVDFLCKGISGRLMVNWLEHKKESLRISKSCEREPKDAVTYEDIQRATNRGFERIADYEKGRQEVLDNPEKYGMVRLYEPRPGAHIRDAVSDAIKEAGKCGGRLIMRFNATYLLVENGSNPDALVKSYLRNWKPSKEQLDWLKMAMKLSKNKPHIHGVIKSLYDQLKELSA